MKEEKEGVVLFLDSEQEVFEQETSASTCPRCGHEKPALRAHLSYWRLLFLPIAPFKRSFSLFCYRCCRSSSTSEARRSMIPTTAILTKFSGLVVLCFALLMYEIWQERAYNQEFELLATPQKFDHYFIDVSRYLNEPVYQPRYKVAKVVGRDEGSVKVVLGGVEYLKKNQVIKAIRLDNMMISGYFSNKAVTLPIESLSKMREDEIIYAAHRPKNLSLFGGLVMRPQLPRAFQPTLPSQVNADAVDLYHLGLYSEALELFRQEAERGEGWAQLNLAQMLRDGEGQEQDFTEARSWFLRAVQQGVPGAKEELKALCLTNDLCDTPSD